MTAEAWTDEVVQTVAHRETLLSSLDEVLRSRPAVVLALSLNGVCRINEKLGRGIGDALLRTICGRLSEFLKSGDQMDQQGGVAFLLMRPNSTAVEGLAWAEEALRLINMPVVIDGQRLTIAGSAGVCVLAPGSVADPADRAGKAIGHASAAMQRARQDSRGRDGQGTVHLYEPGTDGPSCAREAMGSRLRLAVQAMAFSLQYQPQIDLMTRKVTGFEALLRWCDPVEGHVPPSDFVPLAEELGLVGQIGAWALEAACQTARSWPGNLGIAVNVSAVQLNDGTLTAAVHRALETSGLDPARLELELTESCVITNVTAAAETLQALRNLGVRVAIDDFGTGYSSLGGLSDLPVDKIKIDRTFIDGIEHGSARIAIVRAIVGLCAELGVRCTAEGVETEEQLEILSGIACGEGQGYLLGRPTTAQGVAGVLARYGQ